MESEVGMCKTMSTPRKRFLTPPVLLLKPLLSLSHERKFVKRKKIQGRNATRDVLSLLLFFIFSGSRILFTPVSFFPFPVLDRSLNARRQCRLQRPRKYIPTNLSHHFQHTHNCVVSYFFLLFK